MPYEEIRCISHIILCLYAIVCSAMPDVELETYRKG